MESGTLKLFWRGNMKNSSKLWNATGCLSRDAITAWHGKTLSQADKYLIEQHLEECSLCKDALEGYSLLSTDRVFQAFSAIDKVWEEPDNIEKDKVSSRRLKLTLAAAIFIGFIGVFTFFQFYEVKKTDSIAQEIGSDPVLSPASEEPSSEVSRIPDRIPPKVEKHFKPSSEAEEQPTVLADEAAEAPAPVVMQQKEDVPGMEEPLAAAEENRSAEESSQDIAVIGYGTQAKKKSVSRASEISYSEKSVSVAKTNESETTFYVVEQPATFNGGGITKFREYVEEKIITSPDKSIPSGELTVTFTVDLNGNVKDAYVVKGLDSRTDSLVLDIVKKSPAWKPARNGGKPVNMNMVLPLKISAN